MLRVFYQWVLGAGKPKKVALVVCMRKLLTILNRKLRTGERWDPTTLKALTFKTAMIPHGPPRIGSDLFKDWLRCLPTDLSIRSRGGPQSARGFGEQVTL